MAKVVTELAVPQKVMEKQPHLLEVNIRQIYWCDRCRKGAIKLISNRKIPAKTVQNNVLLAGYSAKYNITPTKCDSLRFHSDYGLRAS